MSNSLWIFKIISVVALIIGYFVVTCYLLSKNQRKFRIWINSGNGLFGNTRKNAYEYGVPALVTVATLGLAAKAAKLDAAEKLYMSCPFLLVINLLLPVFFVPLLLLLKDLSNPASATETELMTLFDQLDEVVAQKCKRFSSAAVTTENIQGNVYAKTIFKEITQPEKQIGLLMDALYLYFNIVTGNKGLRVCLARMGDLHIEDIAYYRPHSKKPKDITSLQDPDTGFSKAKAFRRIIVIPDTAKEAAKEAGSDKLFKDTKPQRKGGAGSAICFPVEHGSTTDIPYVISLYSPHKIFSIEEEKKYEMILLSFGIRIAMEHSLLTLREKAQ